MEQWASLELAPWRGRRIDRATLLAGFDAVATRDPTLCTFHIRDGTVSLVSSHEALLDPPGVALVRARTAIFAGFLREVVRRHRVDCDVHLAVRMNDRGREERGVPVFCFHKLRYESNILLPDLDFTIFDYYEGDGFADARAFADKRPEAFFVGATTGGLVTMERLAEGSHQRIRAARFFRDTAGVTFEISGVTQCDDEATRRAVEALVTLSPHHRSWQEQLAHRYLLVMDGNGATWSRNAVTLASNSVPVRYASPYLLYYFHGLEPWVHYVPVRRDADVLDVIDQAGRTAARDEAIARAGRRFARDHLTRDAVTGYMAALLRGYADILAAR